MPVRNKVDETYLRTKRSCTVGGVWQEEIKRVCGNGKREPHWPGKLGLWPGKPGCGPERSQIGLGGVLPGVGQQPGSLEPKYLVNPGKWKSYEKLAFAWKLQLGPPMKRTVCWKKQIC